MQRRHVIGLAGLLLGLAGSGAAWAQPASYPTRPVTLMVAFNPGGSTDIIARLLAQHMGPLLGQNVIVENRGGADGAIGTEAVARAAADGYTLILSTTSTHAINPLLFKSIRYSPSKDFQPVSLVAQSPNLLVSSSKFDAKSVEDVIARAKSSAGGLNVATGATMHLLNAAMFKSMAGVTWVDVPFKGSGPALNALIAGEVDLMFDQLPSSLAQVKAGNLNAVAVTSKERTSIAPDIPTIAESGLPAFEAASWWGMLAPANTPPEIVARLNAAVHEALKAPALLERFATLGIEVRTSTPEEFSAFIVDEGAKWKKVITENDIPVN